MHNQTLHDTLVEKLLNSIDYYITAYTISIRQYHDAKNMVKNDFHTILTDYSIQEI